jgi:hypothetical protein
MASNSRPWLAFLNVMRACAPIFLRSETKCSAVLLRYCCAIQPSRSTGAISVDDVPLHATRLWWQNPATVARFGYLDNKEILFRKNVVAYCATTLQPKSVISSYSARPALGQTLRAGDESTQFAVGLARMRHQDQFVGWSETGRSRRGSCLPPAQQFRSKVRH